MKSAKRQRQPRPLEQREDARASQQAAEHDARRQAAHQIPAHGATPVVRAQARQRGEEDRRHRGGDGHLHGHARGTPLLDRIRVRNGTIIMPPPTPSSPARKPVQMPSAASSADQPQVDGHQRAQQAAHGTPFLRRDRRDRQPVAALASTRIVASSGRRASRAAAAAASCAPAPRRSAASAACRGWTSGRSRGWSGRTAWRRGRASPATARQPGDARLGAGRVVEQHAVADAHRRRA